MLRTYRSHWRQLEQIALVDSVTGGMNNLAFQMECQALIQNAPPCTYAIVAVNIKNFKLINENYGSDAGDDTLRYLMHVLEKCICTGELIARGEADHFFLCLKESDGERIRSRLAKMEEQVNAFNEGREVQYHFTVHQGVYIVDDPTMEITILQDRAKTACQDQRVGTRESCVFYDTAFTKRLQVVQAVSYTHLIL